MKKPLKLHQNKKFIPQKKTKKNKKKKKKKKKTKNLCFW